MIKIINYIRMDNQQIDPNLICPICLEIANSALQSECCGHLFCQQCTKSVANKFSECPYCKKKGFTAKQSKIARRMINQLKVTCPNNCEASKLQYGEMKKHLAKCPLSKINCKFCENIFIRKDIGRHTINEHKQRVKQALIASYQQKDQKESIVNNQLLTNIINSEGRKCYLGASGKYYCGGKLIGRCRCCDGNCGLIDGENCDACMQEDIKRFKLAKGYLINPIGYISKYNKQQGTFYCGRTKQKSGLNALFGGKQSCDGTNICGECKKLMYSICLGRYKNLM